MSEPYSRSELQRWLVELDEDLEEMQATRVWLVDEIQRLLPRPAPEPEVVIVVPPEGPARVEKAPGLKRRYAWVNPTKIRDCIQSLGQATNAEIAEALGISEGSVYNHTKKGSPLYEAGTLVKVRRGGRAYWMIAKPGAAAPPLRAKPPAPRGPRLTSGVAGSGKQNNAARKRRGVNPHDLRRSS